MLLRLMVILRPNVCSLCHPACLLQEEYQFDLDLPHPLVRLLLFLCKNGRGGLINVPFRLRQSGRGSSFFKLKKRVPSTRP